MLVWVFFEVGLMALLGKGHKGMYLSVAFAFGTCIGIRFDAKESPWQIRQLQVLAHFWLEQSTYTSLQKTDWVRRRRMYVGGLEHPEGESFSSTVDQHVVLMHTVTVLDLRLRLPWTFQLSSACHPFALLNAERNPFLGQFGIDNGRIATSWWKYESS